MSLALEIEFLLGTCYAATGPDSALPDWPPQPDRVFSALVASWGARGENEQEAKALEWLESLPPPLVMAPEAFPRMAAVVYVPPNDPQTGRVGNPNVMPGFRSRQPRRFPASRPHSALLRFVWRDAGPDAGTLTALNSLAADTAYVGHSASLTRCRFLRVDGDGPTDARPVRRRSYPGRFAELRRNYQEFVRSGGQRGRPLAGAPASLEASGDEPPQSVFARRWLLLEHVGGDMPDIRASALVGKAIRDTLLAGYGRTGREDRIPEALSGHTPDGSPSRLPHAAIIPLAYVGFPYADGHVMGFAVVPPHDAGLLDDVDFLRALRAVSKLDEVRGRRVMVVKPAAGSGRDGFEVLLSPTFEPPANRHSFDARFYARPSRTFATVTPIVLDRHLKQKGDARTEEMVALISASCRNVGLPEPLGVVPSKHSAIEGAVSAWPSAGSPPWMRWRVPDTFATRQLVHAVITFAEPVNGPIILGAGRHVGLGLCRPLHDGGARR